MKFLRRFFWRKNSHSNSSCIYWGRHYINTSAAGFLPNVNPYFVTETTALNHSLRIQLTKTYSPWSPPLNGQNVMKYQAHKSELYGGWCNTCQCMGRRWTVGATWRWALSCSSTCLSWSQLVTICWCWFEGICGLLKSCMCVGWYQDPFGCRIGSDEDVQAAIVQWFQ